jgi:sugar O-acyltransferase (sialic acid O-acetyltransferase NeuD family)
MSGMAGKAIYVIGGGGHARVVLDALLGAGRVVAGILDPRLPAGSFVYGVPVRGGDEVLDSLPARETILANGVGANPAIAPRTRVFQSLCARGFEFTRIQHASAILGRECSVGAGAQIMAGVVLQAGVRVGGNAVVNTRVSVDHDSLIGAHAFLAPGAVLCGDVQIEERAFIGAAAVVLPGVCVGAGAIVGAGAVVTKAVPAGWSVAGNPAVRIGEAE